MAINYSALEAVGGIGKGVPKPLRESFKKREAARLLDQAYAKVDARDGTIDRVTGRSLVKGLPGTVRAEVWLTRHHMFGRGAGERDNPKHIFVCSWQVHQLIEVGAIEMEGDDADRRLIFRWNRQLVPVGKEPFRILSKRRSQREVA